MSKVVIFHHTDLDGIVSNTVAFKYYHGLGYTISSQSCGYHDIDEKVLGFLSSYQYDQETTIFICDISVSRNVAEKLNSIPNPKVLLDHHQSAFENLSSNGKNLDFSWAFVEEGDSASLMVYRWVIHQSEGRGDLELSRNLQQYNELVHLTDLWDSKSRTCTEYIDSIEKIESLNCLLKDYGLSDFRARFIINPRVEFTESENAVIRTLIKVRDRHVKNVKVYRFKYEREGRLSLRPVYYGLAFSEKYPSETADYVFNQDSELSFVFIINMNNLSGSLRRSGTHDLEEQIDLSKIAEQYGGGGHPYSAGFPITMKNYYDVISSIVRSNFYI